MKTLLTSIFALALMGASAGAANAAILGAHVGPIGIGIGVGHHGHHRHCLHWSHRHPGVCRQWGW